jgi:hypothetical protein
MFVATFPFLVRTVGELFLSNRPGSKAKTLDKIDKRDMAGRTSRFVSVFIKVYILVCLATAILWQAVQIEFVKNPFRSFSRDYPCGAYDFLASHPEYESDRIFNNYAWGGYLIWMMPDKKIFIDGRLPQVEYAGRTFLEEYLDFNKADGKISERLDKYQINLVLIPSSDPVIVAKRWEQIVFNLPSGSLTTPSYIREYLLSSKDWSPVYYDKAAIIFHRHH